MKRIITLFFIFIFAISCSKTENTEEDATDNSLQKVKESGKLVLGLDDAFAPMSFINENEEIVGFDIDLAKEVSKIMGVELETKPVDWASSILSLKKGDIDVIWSGFAVNETRKKQVNFSKPYLYNRLMVAIYAGRDDIKTKEDLKGKVVGVQTGSSNYEILLNDPISKELKEIRQYDTYVNAFLDLEAQRIDAVVAGETTIRYYIAKENANFELLEEEPLTSQYVSVGLRKGDMELLNAIDNALDTIRTNGKASEIATKWFGQDIIVRVD